MTGTYVVAPKPVTQATPGVPMEALLVNQGPVGTVLAEVAGSNPASGAYKYYTHDNIQSTRGLFEQNKSVAGTLEYTPYGENYTSPAPASLTHRFTGLDLDATTGQYYAPYRYYAPNLSRWLTRDPLGMAEGPNVFAYVSASPISLMDRLGLNPAWVGQCAAGAAIGASLVVLGWLFIGVPDSNWAKICQILVGAIFRENRDSHLFQSEVVAPKPVTQATPGVPMEALLVNQGPYFLSEKKESRQRKTGMWNRATRRMGGPPMPRSPVSFGSTFSFPQRKGGRGLFEQNKSVAGTLEYTPYGENYTSPAPAGLTHRFTGLDLDAVTGQYYAPYRYYAPNLSRRQIYVAAPRRLNTGVPRLSGVCLGVWTAKYTPKLNCV